MFFVAFVMSRDDLSKGRTLSEINASPSDSDVEYDINSTPANEIEVTTEFSDDRGTVRKRRRKADPASWKQNVRKRQKDAGLLYVTAAGELKPPKTVLPIPCIHDKGPKKGLPCRANCSNNFSDEMRKGIFDDFYSRGYNQQQEFLARCIERKEVKRRRPRIKDESQGRDFSYQFSFQIDEQKMICCQKFFLATLNIDKSRIYNLFENMTSFGTPQLDQRGGNQKKQHTEEEKQFIREHIASFPVVPSHYCRKSSTRDYLPSNLSLARMYEMYVEWCEASKTAE